MAVFLAHVNGVLKHQCRERDPLYPSPEAECEEDAKDEEHDTRTPVVPPEIEDGSADSPTDVQDTSHPNELLGEHTREHNISKTEDYSDDEDEDEEDYCVGVERKGIRRIVNATALDASRLRISMERDPGDSNEASTKDEELPERVSDQMIIP